MMSETVQYSLPEHLVARRTARRREFGTQLVAVAVAMVCLVMAGMLVTPVNKIRRERQLIIDPATMRGLPPEIELLGKLGTFRALIIDWAAIRATRLKEEGKTYEALQLHEMICRLAPRFPQVWVNAAWDMSYNISVLKYTPEERWQWVQNGIKILRDEAIQYNPKSVTLYKELGWIYWHKVRDFLDDHHLNYKRALAVEMERVFGAPPIAVTDEDYFDWFRKIVDANRDLDHLIETDAEVGVFAARLAQVGFEPDEMFLDFLARHLRPGRRAEDMARDGAEEDDRLARRLAVVTDSEAAEAFERLTAAIRSKVLRERYKFDLDWMLDLMVEQYGPLDWRNAASHTLYWSSWGDKITREQEGLNLADQVNNARFVFFATQSLITAGRVTLWPDFDDPFQSYIEFSPDTRLIEYLERTYLRLGKEQFGDHPDFVEGTPGPRYFKGYVSAMQNWIELLWLEGGERNLGEAERYYAWLRDNNPHPDGSTQERYTKTIEEFVMGDILAQLMTFKAASGFIRALIRRGLKHLSLGQEASARNSLARAKQCYDFWTIDTEIDINERRMMQDFPLIVRDEVFSYMQLSGVAPLPKVNLWKGLPLLQCQMAYDHLLPYFERLCDTRMPPWERGVAFPEPPGMEEFRKMQIDYRGDARRQGVDEGARYKD